MQVILLTDVDHVGLRGDVVSVARGYARNFLLPRQLAEEATPARVAEVEKRDAQRARHEAKTVEDAQAIATTLEKTVLRFEVKAGPTGSLFGSVTPTDIVDELWSRRRRRSPSGAPTPKPRWLTSSSRPRCNRSAGCSWSTSAATSRAPLRRASSSSSARVSSASSRRAATRCARARRRGTPLCAPARSRLRST